MSHLLRIEQLVAGGSSRRPSRSISTLATMSPGDLGTFALIFMPPWLACQGANHGRSGLLLALLIGLPGYLVAFLAALGLDQPLGPVLAVVLTVGGLVIA